MRYVSFLTGDMLVLEVCVILNRRYAGFEVCVILNRRYAVFKQTWVLETSVRFTLYNTQTLVLVECGVTCLKEIVVLSDIKWVLVDGISQT